MNSFINRLMKREAFPPGVPFALRTTPQLYKYPRMFVAGVEGSGYACCKVSRTFEEGIYWGNVSSWDKGKVIVRPRGLVHASKASTGSPGRVFTFTATATCAG